MSRLAGMRVDVQAGLDLRLADHDPLADQRRGRDRLASNAHAANEDRIHDDATSTRVDVVVPATAPVVVVPSAVVVVLMPASRPGLGTAGLARGAILLGGPWSARFPRRRTVAV